jgi:hypothetical protein
MDLNKFNEEIGPHGWIRRGLTYVETANKQQAEMSSGITFHQIIDLDELAVKQGHGNFCVGAFADQAFVAGCFEPTKDEIAFIQSAIQSGIVLIRNTFFLYPEYPVMYLRMLIPTALSETKSKYRGELIECMADYTEANFQEWVVTVCNTHNFNIILQKPDGNLLANGLVKLEQFFIDDLLKAMDEADTELRKIPKEQRNFRAAGESFFKDHPNPFLFD